MKLRSRLHSGISKAFTLVEVIAVMTIIAIFAGISIMPVLTIIDNSRKRAEAKRLAMIADEIRASFMQEELQFNISALPGEVSRHAADGADAMFTTLFDDHTYAPVDNNAWFAKLAWLRGQRGLSEAEGSDIYGIKTNAWRGRRVLLRGPIEDNQQRYILLSFMFPHGATFALPDPATGYGGDYDAWFNSIYDHKWGAGEINLGVGDATWAAWRGRAQRGQTFFERVACERIVQPRYRISVNNRTGNEIIKVYANMQDGRGPAVDAARTIVAGRSYIVRPGAVISTAEEDPGLGHRVGILAGRRVRVYRVAFSDDFFDDYSSEGLIYSFLLNEEVTVFGQQVRLPDAGGGGAGGGEP
ncbi:type II secretion system GspH family protein [Termitidicoccus mucosus]|uniref:Uncharacterized protein n=1 Tax=Termitidicoccus mucosus TaxID=1184151 RepID=A0A178IJ67_9BACT|nr:hypothetical protein AW736_11575 [Opitutaceae bacterium TSB47]